MIPLWVWVLVVLAMVPLAIWNMRQSPQDRWSLVPTFGGLLLFMGFLHVLPSIVETMNAPHDYDLPECPGAGISHHEQRVTGNGGAENLIQQFQAAGWSNMTSSVRGSDGFWSDPYTVVAAECATGGRR